MTATVAVRPLTAPFLLVLMLVAAVMALVLKPTWKMASQGEAVDLARAIPERFGDWQIDESVLPVTVAKDVQDRLNDLYTQVLARTYRNARGERVMLSIAYGADQLGESGQVHRPEFCYGSQGFRIDEGRDGALSSPYGTFPVRRLVATSGTRVEPISYWVTVGEVATLPGLERKRIQLGYGLTGVIPDGLLFRVSVISNESDLAYQIQDQFILDLLAASPEDLRRKLIGTHLS